jgi:hypothetical protein
MQGLHLDGQVCQVPRPAVGCSQCPSNLGAKWVADFRGAQSAKKAVVVIFGSAAMGGAGAVLSTFRVAPLTTYDGAERNRSRKYPTASRWIPTTRLPANRISARLRTACPRPWAYRPLQPRRPGGRQPDWGSRRIPLRVSSRRRLRSGGRHCMRIDCNRRRKHQKHALTAVILVRDTATAISNGERVVLRGGK